MWTRFTRGKTAKEIYWSGLFLANASMQALIIVVLFCLYRFFSPAPEAHLLLPFGTALLVTLSALAWFIKCGKLNSLSSRLIYLGALIPIFFNIHTTEPGVSYYSYNLLWILAIHISGIAVLSLKEVFFWTLSIIAAFTFAPRFESTGFTESMLRFMVWDNWLNAVGIFITVTVQVVIYRLANQLSERDLKKVTHEIEHQLEDNRSLVRVLVHDIANPLTAASTYVLMEAQKNPTNARLAKIQNSLDRIARLIEGVRTIQKVSDGKSTLELSSVNLKLLSQTLLSLFEHRLEEKRIHLVVEGSEVVALANADWFENQIAANLVSNAIKFTPEGGEIRISTEYRGDKAIWKVRDNGIGIPPDLQEKLFDLRAHTTRTGTSGESGTGYGLPIVRNLVERMNGQLRLHSATEGPYRGTEFEVELESAQ